MKTKLLGYFLICVSLGVFAFILYRNSFRTKVPLVFSVHDLLDSTWQKYKVNYLDPTTGRPVDTERNNVTTSEGVSYMLLRAVWMDDKSTFDQTLTWAQTYLRRPHESLFSWLYGERSPGVYGVLTSQDGQNTASDADSDIALALVFASHRWTDPSYLPLAKKMINDIWNDDVIVIKGVPYMSADNVEKTSPSTRAVINPSYLSPYAYRIFAKLDPAHSWNALVDSSYGLLQESTISNLNASTTALLPPDWVTINKTTGTIAAGKDPALDTHYSYDALRVPWRIALDYQWFGEPRAKGYLAMLGFLADQWQKNKALASDYAHDGSVVSSTEVPAMYGGSMGYFTVVDPHDAEEVYDNKLLFLYNPDSNNWKERLGYYNDNWVWFGIALQAGVAANLSS